MFALGPRGGARSTARSGRDQDDQREGLETRLTPATTTAASTTIAVDPARRLHVRPADPVPLAARRPRGDVAG